MENLKRFLQNYKGTQVLFNTRYIDGRTETIYRQNNIRVDYCKYYNYLEIYGLTQEEFNSLVEYVCSVAHIKDFDNEK